LSSSTWSTQTTSKKRALSHAIGRVAQRYLACVRIANCRLSAVDLIWPGTSASIQTRDHSLAHSKDVTNRLSSGVRSPSTTACTPASDLTNVSFSAAGNPSAMYSRYCCDLTVSLHHLRVIGEFIPVSARTSATLAAVRKGTRRHKWSLIAVSVEKPH
jgi:hypothetical protein